MNTEEINEVLAPLFPRGGESSEGYISATDLREALIQLMGLVARDIQRALASVSAYGSYVHVCDTELQWEALQSEAVGGTLPDGSLAYVKASALGTSKDEIHAWDGSQWVQMAASV
jgi:hypothetical protein